MQRVPITKEGYERLKFELQRLQKEERPANIRAIEEARNHGDITENAEYEAAKEKQALIEGRINDLCQKIGHSEIIECGKNDHDRVVFGATVIIEDLETGENVTYRLEVHSTSDDPKRYRTDEEVQQWQKRDPLPRFQKYLMDKGLLTDAEIQALEEEIQNEIKAAVERTEEQMKELSSQPAIMFEQIYAELPPHLEAQKEELARELEQVEETHG